MLTPLSKSIIDLLNNPSVNFLSSDQALLASNIVSGLTKMGFPYPFTESIFADLYVETGSYKTSFPKERRVYLNDKLFLIERAEKPGVIQYFFPFE